MYQLPVYREGWGESRTLLMIKNKNNCVCVCVRVQTSGAAGAPFDAEGRAPCTGCSKRQTGDAARTNAASC